MQMKKNKMGFSLIELVIAMAVIAIGLAITIPAMQGFNDSNRRTTYINSLAGDIGLAKSESIKRGVNVTISQLTGTAGDWHNGWEITVGATTLKSSPAFDVSNITLIEFFGASSIVFKPNGRISGSALSFNLCDSTNTEPDNKRLDITASGRISSSQITITCP